MVPTYFRRELRDRVLQRRRGLALPFFHQSSSWFRHARPCAGHPRLVCCKL